MEEEVLDVEEEEETLKRSRLMWACVNTGVGFATFVFPFYFAFPSSYRRLLPSLPPSFSLSLRLAVLFSVAHSH